MRPSRLAALTAALRVIRKALLGEKLLLSDRKDELAAAIPTA
jgi:hypothetical protein